MSPRTTAIIGGIGRTLVTLGCLTVAFAGFQLWGTGLAEGMAQDELADDFELRQQAFVDFASEIGIDASEVGEPAPTLPSTTLPPTSQSSVGDDEAPATTVLPDSPEQPPVPAAAVPPGLLPAIGDALGVIRIPQLDLDKVIIAGTRRDDLRKGPGHYPNTPLPGQAGNAAIAGHRTTYGAPFGDLDQLKPGDVVEVETFQGTFVYEVLPQAGPDGVKGHFIVAPQQVEVLNDFGDNRLTLTACHPKYSARQRIVVQAELVDAPAATINLEIAEEDLESPPEGDLAYEATGVDSDTGSSDERPAADSRPDNDRRADEGNTVGLSEDALDESLGWHMEELGPFAVWSLLTGAAAGLALLAGHRWRKWPAYLASSPVVLTLLFFSFTHLDRMLPAF